MEVTKWLKPSISVSRIGDSASVQAVTRVNAEQTSKRTMHWKTITFVGGLTLAGFVAPMLLDGPMDGESFLAWVEQMLAPTLRPDDIVVMDNLAAHKVAGVSQALKACGAELHYLPPYRPDLNPIENAFAKLKAHTRKSAARTLDALERAAANALEQFKPTECANFFAHAGYSWD
jgi:transposase